MSLVCAAMPSVIVLDLERALDSYEVGKPIEDNIFYNNTGDATLISS